MLKTFSKDFIIYGIGLAATRLISIIILPITTQYLSVSEIGLVEMMNGIVNIGSLFCLFGIDTALSFYYWDSKNETLLQNAYIFWSGLLILIFTIVTISGLMLLRPILFQYYFKTDFNSYRFIYLIVPLNSIFLFLTKLFRIKREPVIYSLISIINVITLYVGFILFFEDKADIKTFFLIKTFAFVITICFALFLFIKKSSFDKRALKDPKKIITNLLKYGVPIMPLLLSSWIITNTDRFFLNSYYDLSLVGQFSVAYKLASIISLFLFAFSMVWGPYAMSIKDSEKSKLIYSKLTFIFLYISLFLVIVIQLFSTQIINIFTSNSNQFIDNKNLFGILGLSLVLNTLFSLLAVGLNIKKKTYLISCGSLLAVVINVISNTFLVKNFGMFGAAISSCIAYTITSIFILIISRKIYKINYDYFAIGIILFLSFTFYIMYFNKMNIDKYILIAYLLFGFYYYKKNKLSLGN